MPTQNVRRRCTVSPGTRTGRRPGDSGTREAILEAARRQFAERGYDRASLRAIAAEAGVDPGLVTHFHGSKQALFVAVVELPFEPAEVLPELLAGGTEDVGERVARFPGGRARVRRRPLARPPVWCGRRPPSPQPPGSCGSSSRRGSSLRWPSRSAPRTPRCGPPSSARRSSAIVMARYVVGVEPLASADPEAVVQALAPTLQRYLTGPIASEDDA